MHKVVSSKLIRTELAARGYTAETIQLDKKYTRYMSPGGGVWLTHNGHLSYPFVIGSTSMICDNKLLSAKFAECMGVQTAPTMLYAGDMGEALRFMNTYAPLITKPLNSQGARGLTYNISDSTSLKQGIKLASEFSNNVLLQRQFEGEEVRITVSRGSILVSILRATPRVIGDGKHTIAELLAIENESRAALLFDYLEYPQLTESIIAVPCNNEKRVPAEGEVVELSRSRLASQGATFHDISNDLHEDYKNIALKLTNRLNPEFMVVDLLVRDYTRPAADGAYMFLEFTAAPALSVYYSLRGSNPYDIVSVFADMIDEYCANTAGQN